MGIRWICAAMLFLLCVTIPFHTAIGQESPSADRITQLMQEGNYAEAHPLLEEALRDTLLPRNQRANRLFQLAYTLIELEEYRASVNTWHALIAIVENHPMIWGNTGWSHYLEGNLDSAIIATQHSLRIDESQAWVWGNMGLYQLAAGDLVKMRKSYQRAAKKAKALDVWDAVRFDLEVLCGGENPPEGCEEAWEVVNTEWMTVLRAVYVENEGPKGEELVRAHRVDYEKLRQALSEETVKAEGAKREWLEALLKRLNEDLK